MKTKSIYVRIADIQRFTGAGRDAVLDAAKIFNHRIVGHCIWFDRGHVSPDLVSEIWKIDAMHRAQAERRKNHHEAAPINSHSPSPASGQCPEARP